MLPRSQVCSLGCLPSSYRASRWPFVLVLKGLRSCTFEAHGGLKLENGAGGSCFPASPSTAETGLGASRLPLMFFLQEAPPFITGQESLLCIWPEGPDGRRRGTGTAVSKCQISVFSIRAHTPWKPQNECLSLCWQIS